MATLKPGRNTMQLDAADDEINQALIKARALIDLPDAWCKGIAYKYRQQEVVARCAQSALTDASTSRAKRAAWQFMTEYVLRSHGLASIANFNDLAKTTHADVLALFDRAIAERRATLSMR